MKWGSTTASGSSFRALQPSTSFKADSRTEATPTFFLNAPCGAGCLPTGHFARVAVRLMSQCTFWCWVLTNAARWASAQAGVQVSMHLLVPGAYQRTRTPTLHHAAESLNAPSGAGCLPTSPTPTPDPSPKRLNTPCGAGCLSTEIGLQYGNEKASQYTMWCWVLIDGCQ